MFTDLKHFNLTSFNEAAMASPERAALAGDDDNNDNDDNTGGETDGENSEVVFAPGKPLNKEPDTPKRKTLIKTTLKEVGYRDGCLVSRVQCTQPLRSRCFAV